MWIWSERTYRPTSKKPHGKNPQAIKFLIFQFLYFPYLLFDHHWTTTVQWCCKMSKKPVVTTNNGLFPVLGAAVQNQQNLRFIDGLYRPVVVLRPGRPEVRILPVALKKRIAIYFCNALFVLMLFGFSIISVTYHLRHRCTVLLPAVHFSADL